MIDIQLMMEIAEHVHDTQYSGFKDLHPDDKEPFITDARITLEYLENRGLLKEAP